MKKIIAALLIATVACTCAGCGNNKNVAPQANLNEDETKYPEDTREGIDTDCTYGGDWDAVTFADGNKVLPVSAFEAYEDTGVTVEICFYLEDADYYCLGLANFDNWDEKLYTVDHSYVTGVATQEEAFGENNVPLYYVNIQQDGYFSFAGKEIRDHNVYSFSFNLSGDAIKYIKENGGKSQGFVLQSYGVTVTKVIIDSEPVDMSVNQ